MNMCENASGNLCLYFFFFKKRQKRTSKQYTVIRRRHSAPKLVNVREARSKHRSRYVVLINSNSEKKKRQQTTKQHEQNYLVSFVTTERQKCKTQHKHTYIHAFLSRHVLELRGREKQHLQRRRGPRTIRAFRMEFKKQCW